MQSIIEREMYLSQNSVQDTNVSGSSQQPGGS